MHKLRLVALLGVAASAMRLGGNLRISQLPRARETLCLLKLQGEQQVISKTHKWVDRVVIGHNLCPFASAVRAQMRVRIALAGRRHDDTMRAVPLHTTHQYFVMDTLC